MKSDDMIMSSNGLSDESTLIETFSEDENLWMGTLSEVQTADKTKLPSNKQLLVLGDNGTGKTTLIAKLQGIDSPEKGSALEYAYINVSDEYREDHTRLGVWILDGEPAHSNLLQFALNQDTLPHTMVMFVVSMTTPWNIIDELQKWASALQDHIDNLNIGAHDYQELTQRNIKRWYEYVDQGDDLDGDNSLPNRRISRNYEEEQGLPLGEGILERNLGVDIVVVVTKTDYMSTLEKDLYYKEEHFDFVQQYIRKFCLKFGAGLFYTSAKEDKNCDLLYKYLAHRLYGIPFRTSALIVEKDAVLIPSGWDNMKKVGILYENMQSIKPDDYYTDVISKPIVRKPTTREPDVLVEDEQGFLGRMLGLLQQNPAANVTPRPDNSLPQIRTPVGVQKTGDRRMSNSPGGVIMGQGGTNSPKKMIDPTKVGATSPGGEGVLANFFNSLLLKKTAQSPLIKTNGELDTSFSPNSSSLLTSTPNADKAAMRCDAAAELDRLTKKKNALLSSSSPISSLQYPQDSAQHIKTEPLDDSLLAPGDGTPPNSLPTENGDSQAATESS
uniref:Dynein light intermediate chain n=2 Tax=Cacopsylla melanoneura TaxID=428564 RepID=A0A8D9DQ38_9HEMI